MSTIEVIGVALLAVLAVALGAYVVAVYNSLVEVRNNIDKAWGDIDVLLQQRHDELPNLVDSVKGYVRHEHDRLDRLARLRTGYDQAPSIEQKALAENALNRELGRLRVTWEAHPDLEASSLFARVMARISALESSIADRRELFNESVTIYNIRITQLQHAVPARRAAGPAGPLEGAVARRRSRVRHGPRSSEERCAPARGGRRARGRERVARWRAILAGRNGMGRLPLRRAGEARRLPRVRHARGSRSTRAG